MPVNARDSAGTAQGQSRDKTGTNRNKQGQADEYNNLHQYQHSYIDFPFKNHCSDACTPCF